MHGRIHINKNKCILYLVLSLSLIFGILNTIEIPLVTADQYTLNDTPEDGYEWIYPNECQYYTLNNDNQETSMIINISILMKVGSTHGYGDIALDVWDWDSYINNRGQGTVAHNRSLEYEGKVTFTLELGRYVIRVKNMYTASTEWSVYNITFITGVGVSFYNDPYFGRWQFQEQIWKEEELTLSYYFTIDPWLYDTPSNIVDNPITVIVGYDNYGELRYLNPSAERYFLINNYWGDVNMFVGVNAYTLSHFGDLPLVTMTVSDWNDLDGGHGAMRQADIDSAYRENWYAAGFNFSCKKDHRYQIWIHNVDPDYGLFMNVSFYIWGDTADITFVESFDPNPDAQITVNPFYTDPWLEYRKESRSLQYGWIFGGIGIGALAFGLFYLKARFF
jgi:hypothetical protein